MSNWKNDDGFLGRWLQGELSPEEKAAFEASEEFEQFTQIIAVSDDLELPAYPQEKAYDQLMHSLRQKERGKQRQLRSIRLVSIAASLLLLVVLWYVVTPEPPNNGDVVTQNMEKESLDLPDGSRVELHAASKLSYDRKNWKKNRVVKLEGEAFFSVEKGEKFVVELACGKVTVLGTSFNVKNRDGHCEVICYTGKVMVTSAGNVEEVLLPGQGLRLSNATIQPLKNLPATEEPGWTQGYSELIDVPFSEALEELKIIYDLDIIPEGELPGDSIRVDIPHDNVDTAIKFVLTPFDLNYEYNAAKKELRILAD